MPITSWAPRLAEMKARPHTQAGIERPARKKSLLVAHIALQREPDAEDEGEVDQHDEPVDDGQVHGSLACVRL